MGFEKMYGTEPQLRPQTVRLVCRLLAVLLDSGTVSCGEYDFVRKHLIALSKTGEIAPVIPPKLIKGQEAAAMLNVSYSQFRQLEKAGAFPFKRRMVGNKTVRYRNSDIIRYIEAGNGPENGGEATA